MHLAMLLVSQSDSHQCVSAALCQGAQVLHMTNNSSFGTPLEEEACISFDIQELFMLKPVFKSLSSDFVKMALNLQTTNDVKASLGN